VKWNATSAWCHHMSPTHLFFHLSTYPLLSVGLLHNLDCSPERDASYCLLHWWLVGFMMYHTWPPIQQKHVRRRLQ
jgi:hypothetical protein